MTTNRSSQRKRQLMALGIFAGLILLGLAPTYHRVIFRNLFRARSRRRSEYTSEKMEASCPVNQYNTTKRTEFGTQGCSVYGWPSSGGVLMKSVDAVELMFLGVDRFQTSSRSLNVVEEDRFCNRMCMLGAKWWGSEDDYIQALMELREKTAVESSELIIGWPTAGGVWVLRFESEEKIPKDLGSCIWL